MFESDQQSVPKILRKITRHSFLAPLPPQSMLTRTGWSSIASSYANDEISSQFSTVKCSRLANLCKTPQSALLQAKAYGTRCSQAVPHPSTILARRCLTSVIRRERVCSSWYGRRQQTSTFGRCHDQFVIFSRLARARHKLRLVWT